MGRRTASGLVGVAALALLVPGAPPAAAEPAGLSCGQTVTADVTFTEDVVGCTGNGLVVGAANVTIDLNGHRLAARDFFSPVGIRNDGYPGLRVVGGHIQDFETGVFVHRADHATIARTTITGSPQAVLVTESSHGTIADNDITGIGASGVVLSSVQRYKVVGNRLSRHGDGILLYGSSRNRIARNTSSDSRDGMLLFHGSNHNVVTQNRTDREQDTGILILDHSDDNVILRNRASGSGAAGIRVAGSARNVVRKNVTNDNLGAGIAVLADAERTVLSGNRADRNGTAPAGCFEQRCPLLDDGIHVAARRTTLVRNHADRNADLGIEAVAGVKDKGRNSAHRNGDPRQCVNVTCR